MTGLTPRARTLLFASLTAILVGMACAPDRDGDTRDTTTSRRSAGLAAVLDHASQELFAELPPAAMAHSADLRAEDMETVAAYAERHGLLYTEGEVCVTGAEAVCQRAVTGTYRWVHVEKVTATDDNSLRVTLAWFDQVEDVEYDTGLLLGSAEFLAVWTPQGWKVDLEIGSLEQSESEPRAGFDAFEPVTAGLVPQQTCGKVGGRTESTNCKEVTLDEYHSIRDMIANPYDRWGDFLNWLRCEQIITMVETAWRQDKWFWYDTAAGDTQWSIITGWHYGDQMGLRRGRGEHQVMTTAMHESYHHAGYSHSAAFTRKVGWWSQNCIQI